MLAAGSSARAQGKDPVAAEALFQQGLRPSAYHPVTWISPSQLAVPAGGLPEVERTEWNRLSQAIALVLQTAR